MNKIRLLIITPFLPFPLKSGGTQGLFHMINNLRDLVDISMIFPVKENQYSYYSELSKIWENVCFFPFFEISRRTVFEKVIIKTIKFIFKKIKKYLSSSESSNLLRMNMALNTSPPTVFDSAFLELVMKAIRDNSFEIIQVEFYPSLPLVQIIPYDVKTIFVHHEIRYVRNKRELELLERKTLKDEYLFLLYKNYELNMLQKYSAIITLTDIDKDELKQNLNNKNIFSSPLLIQPGKCGISKQRYKFNNKLTFIGNSDHFPNLDGIDWFLKVCWDRIQQKNKDLEFHIIGSWNKKQIAPYVKKYNNVYFDGFVDDLYATIENSIMLIPLRIGSGMRMKIIDAVNAKIPFVTTTIGVEGLNFITEKDCIIADGEVFVDAVLKLVNDEFLQLNVIKNAQEVLNNHYSPKDLFERRLDIYKYLVSNSKN